ncbi:unnamed protein product [Cylicocyclus nassatus]|uniref:Uncharacterized protein n=1 Tax=Cylicocyclus nassatus TaxID=53992 RepID=A0AA36GVN1_CYLNA|nr:unnamed protein product [Cylicocyclus nassatus]
MEKLQLLLFILRTLGEEAPPPPRRQSEQWLEEHRRRLEVLPPDLRAMRQFVVVHKLTALLEALSEMPIEHRGIRSLFQLCGRLFEVATGAFNGASGTYIVNYRDFRIIRHTSNSFRFTCSNEVCRPHHTLYEHHLNRRVALRYPRAFLLDFSPEGTTSAVMAIEQVWLMFPRLPQAILQVHLEMRVENNNEQCADMWRFLFIPWVVAAPSGNPCHPHFNEMSVLHFTTTNEEQFIELSVREECYNAEEMKNLKLNSYGILVLNTKPSLMGDERNFQSTTFVDFNNEKWPKSSRVYQAFFTVGSAEGDNDVPPGHFPRGVKKINFNFFTGRRRMATCSRFVNWPYCNQVADASQNQDLLKFYGRSRSTPAPRIHSEHHYLEGQTVFVLLNFKKKDTAEFASMFSYVLTTQSGNLYYKPDNLVITGDKQKWISSRAVDIVVLSPSDDVSKVTPMNYLDNMWPQHSKDMVFQILNTEQFSAEKSLSMCGNRWALTSKTPGYDNNCNDEDTIFLDQWIRREDDPIRPEPQGLPRQDGAEVASTTNSWQLSPSYLPPRAQSPVNDDLDLFIDMPGTSDVGVVPYPSAAASEVRSEKLESKVAKLLEIVQSIALRQKAFGEQQKILTIESQQATSMLSSIREEMKEKSELQTLELQLQDENLRRKFGLYRDPMETQKFEDDLKQLTINEEKLNPDQIKWLKGKHYLRYYRDEEYPGADFFRCALCNRKATAPFDAKEGFRKCQTDSDLSTTSNLLGENSVLCVKRMAQQARDEERPRRLISRLIERISKHEKSTQHSQCLEEYKKEADDISGRITPDDISATVTSTFAAYVIAKEGLPFSKQFPLLIMSMRSGSVGVTLHHDSTTARRMISAFAVHMKYDLVKYVVKNNLPFSLLLDGSSSSRGVKWIVFLLRTLSTDYRPMTFHFSY